MKCIELPYLRSRLGAVYLRCCISDDGFVDVFRVLKRSGKEVVMRGVRLCKAIPFLGAYCDVCAHPLPLNYVCRAHSSEREVLDKTIAVGMYYTKDVVEELASQGIWARNALTSYILELKNRKLVAPLLGIAMATVLHTRIFGISPDDIDIVTYVPKHPMELKRDVDTGEEYNQSELLAEIVSRVLNKPLKSLVIKTQPLSLSGLRTEDRYKHAREVYRIDREYINDIKGSRILIVDDVRTSGATANAIAEKLKGVGASKTYLLVAGRATLKTQFIEFVMHTRKRRS